MPASLAELVEPAPDAFEHRTFEPGESIDWMNGVFFFDVESGRTAAYRSAGMLTDDIGHSPDGAWVRATLWTKNQELLLRRESGQAWQWSVAELRLLAMSPEHLLFEQTRGITSWFTLANHEMKEVKRFSIENEDIDERWSGAFFSPDGDMIALSASKASNIFLIPVHSLNPSVLFEAHDHDEFGKVRGITITGRGYHWYVGHPFNESGPWISVYVTYESSYEEFYFTWEGEALSELPHPECPGTLSPDGRYVAIQEGEPIFSIYRDTALVQPWPSVIIVDATTCDPLFRVRSAHLSLIFWDGQWLSNSEGFVMGVKHRTGRNRNEFVIVRIHPEPVISYLPRTDDSERISYITGPVPAPTGDGCYFLYDFSGVYDYCMERWMRPDFQARIWGPFSWDDTHHEVRYSTGYWGEGGGYWLLLPPKIEFPPFSVETAFRIARTGSCLYVREDPGPDAPVVTCLPDGVRLLFAERNVEPGERGDHASIRADYGDDASYWFDASHWVYVRTPSGAEGWVAHEYLDWY